VVPRSRARRRVHLGVPGQEHRPLALRGARSGCAHGPAAHLDGPAAERRRSPRARAARRLDSVRGRGGSASPSRS
jgi:hypothetical protein